MAGIAGQSTSPSRPSSMHSTSWSLHRSHSTHNNRNENVMQTSRENKRPMHKSFEAVVAHHVFTPSFRAKPLRNTSRCTCQRSKFPPRFGAQSCRNRQPLSAHAVHTHVDAGTWVGENVAAPKVFSPRFRTCIHSVSPRPGTTKQHPWNAEP